MKALLLDLLKSRFGFSSFRPHQEEVCLNLSNGRDALLVMPTGAGKSLCYQLPGLALGGTTLVISPLLALIEDQVEKLKALGLSSERIHSGRKREESRQACIDYLNGRLDFLFVAPERLAVPGFIEMLKKRLPTLIAIDEAHCISQWGHDFRPDYRLIGDRIHELRPSPVVGLTATATPIVQDDIVQQLRLKNPLKSIHGFRRTNIAIQVVEISSSDRSSAVQTILEQEKRLPAIIYAPTRKVAEQLYQDLKAKIQIGLYHAGMTAADRERNQELFLNGKIEAMVATVAFGMGIDKSNIRTVIHAALPGSVEGYYQEIGRAGRDGQPSIAILLQSFADQRTHDFFFERDYPEASILNQIYKNLTATKTPKEDLKKLLKDMESETFDKALEKLWIHRGALIDPEENVSKGSEIWEKTYIEQRRHRERQVWHMIDYARSSQCRMLSLVKHFGDQNDSGVPCGECDTCHPVDTLNLQTTRPLNLTEQQTVAQIMAILAGESYRPAGKIFTEITEVQPKLSRSDFEKILQILDRARWIKVVEEHFEKNGEKIAFRKVSVSQTGQRAGADDLAALRIFGKDPSIKKVKTRKKKPSSGEILQAGPVEALKSWRLGEARKKGIPAFRIFSDRVLFSICENLPKTEEELLRIQGVGPKLATSYGKQIIKLISS